MKRVEISELYRNAEQYADTEICVAGWVRSIRSSNRFGFLSLSDGSCFDPLQVVLEAERLAAYDTVVAQNVGAAVSVTGRLILTPEAQQPFELHAGAVSIEGESAPDYPLQKKRHTLEYLRTMPHLRARTNTFQAVFRVRSECAFAIHDFFHSRGFVYVHTPIITTSDCEGAGEMFRVSTLDPANVPLTKEGTVDYGKDFFGRAAMLTVSGQLAAECFAMAFSNVYTFGPAFRAENSNTARHAAEFWMVEPEIAFADLADDMALAEDMLGHILRHLFTACPRELAFLDARICPGLIARLEAVAGTPFARVTYTEAIGLLQKSGEPFSYPAKWGEDLATEHERYLTEQVFKRPVFVTDWPRQIKAFYMRQNDDGKTVAAMDLLVPGVGELVGGSQREERTDLLKQSYARCGLNPESYGFYTDLRRFGGTKHAGFGLGFERLVMYVTGIANIRDAEAFPRTAGNAEF